MQDYNKKYFYKNIFQNKIYRMEGESYQEFFSKIMQIYRPDFRKIKPQGKKGDGGNDGYIREEGIYYQVYAPENVRINDLVNKVNDDFHKLYNNWNDISEIKEYNFVLNNKYKGLVPELEKCLKEIEDKYKIKCKSLLTEDSERIFFELSEDKILEILDIPMPNLELIEIDYQAMKEVVEYIMSYEINNNYDEEKVISIDFDKKIEFNKLSQYLGNLLKTANYQVYIIEDYFKSDFELKKHLRDKLNKIYNQVKQNLSSINNGDIIFWEILKKINQGVCGINKQSIFSALMVLISYYFEYCDIYEIPNKE